MSIQLGEKHGTNYGRRGKETAVHFPSKSPFKNPLCLNTLKPSTTFLWGGMTNYTVSSW